MKALLLPARTGLVLAATLGSLLLAPPVPAGVPEPDTILYGTLTLDGLTVTAARTDVVVEARRLIAGAALASYTMGSDAQAGDFYALRLPLESATPPLDPLVFRVSDPLFVVVSDRSGFRGQTAMTVHDRGVTERLDLSFGLATGDADQDGLPDAWETANLGGTGSGPNTINPNGQTARQNYLAGTNPNDPTSLFEVDVAMNANQIQVTFLACRAEGPGYEGRTRLYSLESNDDLNTAWESVPGFTSLVGNNALIQFTRSATNPPSFFRGRVWLE